MKKISQPELAVSKPHLEKQQVCFRRPKYWGVNGRVANLYRLLAKAEREA